MKRRWLPVLVVLLPIGLVAEMRVVAQTPVAPAAGRGQGRGNAAPQTKALPRTYRPITTAMLEKPDPGDWLHWRRTPDNWGYSPLTQINKTNVHQLQLAWAFATETGAFQAAPLVHDGVMFIPETPGIVQALDAVTGDLLWQYKKTFIDKPDYSWGARTRTLAIYGDKVYVGTPDAHLVALDAHTGKVVWDQTVADYKMGYRYTSGPIAVKGKIIAGMTGCERYKPEVCFITAHDPETGKELWRFHTIALPGEPGGDTWGDLPVNKRAGSDVWIPGAYDPAQNLMFWSTSNPKPWAAVSAKRGNQADALYTNSVLAIDPDTGKLAWHYQVIPGEQHDLDEVFENVLIDHDGKASLFKMGKMGVLWEIDRKGGKFVAGSDLGYQNLMEFNRKTGKITYNPSMIPKLGEPVKQCPSMGGVRNWQASAYHPATKTLYIPIHPGCETAQYGEVKEENIGPFFFYGNPPYNGVTHLGNSGYPGIEERGQLVAMRIDGTIAWRHILPSGGAPSSLTLGGGLVVTADADRYLYVDDAVDGTTLFKTRLPSGVTGFPISYAVNGKQYIAVPVAARQPFSGNAMYVFALPAAARPAAAPATRRDTAPAAPAAEQH